MPTIKMIMTTANDNDYGVRKKKNCDAIFPLHFSSVRMLSSGDSLFARRRDVCNSSKEAIL